jgi:hypothetical protein
VDGRFLHTVQDTDRLDHLAFKYYEQPRDWWRIADANPSFLSPEALLGAAPFVTIHVPVSRIGYDAPWSELLRALRERPGIDEVRAGVAGRPHPDVVVITGPSTFSIAPALVTEIEPSVRAGALTPPLAAALAAEGVTFTEPRIANVDAVTWRIFDHATRAVYTIRDVSAEALLNVHESALQHDWMLEVVYARTVLDSAAVLAAIAAQGFEPGVASEVHRVGKSIVIPPRRT